MYDESLSAGLVDAYRQELRESSAGLVWSLDLACELSHEVAGTLDPMRAADGYPASAEDLAGLSRRLTGTCAELSRSAREVEASGERLFELGSFRRVELRWQTLRCDALAGRLPEAQDAAWRLLGWPESIQGHLEKLHGLLGAARERCREMTEAWQMLAQVLPAVEDHTDEDVTGEADVVTLATVLCVCCGRKAYRFERFCRTCGADLTSGMHEEHVQRRESDGFARESPDVLSEPTRPVLSMPAPESAWPDTQQVPGRGRPGLLARLADRVRSLFGRSHEAPYPELCAPQPGPMSLDCEMREPTMLCPVPSAGDDVAPPAHEAAAPAISSVRFSAVVPEAAVRSAWSLVDIVMYEDGWEHAVEEVAGEHDGPTRTVSSGWTEAQRGTNVRVVLSSPELGQVGEREGRWCGRFLRFDFAFKVPDVVPGDEVLMEAKVLFDEVPATRLTFVLGLRGRAGQLSVLGRRDVRTAFVSYAHEDMSRVAIIIQGIEAARPDMDVFFDVERLRTGTDWRRVLEEEVRCRDLLFLCWSNHARNSVWVDHEWRCAYADKGIDGIEPVAIDPPEVCPPPEELRQKHFSSRLLYYANARM